MTIDTIHITSQIHDLSSADNINDIINVIYSHNQDNINFYWLGMHNYQPIWNLQKKLHQLRIDKKIGDIVLLLEHNHVYTLGKNADENHILPSKPNDADIIKIDRGGDVTYHGPGQLVGYPIIDLHDYKMSISWYMNVLSESIIHMLKDLNIEAYYKDDYVGVWVEDEKIAAFGVRLAKWITMHGFALNINTNLDYFEGMIPCGIFEYGVTSAQNFLNKELKIKDIASMYPKYFLNHLNKGIA
tara:strand:- start:558 stop:1286 length:729 start_codon:yes stop_codon:yes gene_type:complete